MAPLRTKHIVVMAIILVLVAIFGYLFIQNKNQILYRFIHVSLVRQFIFPEDIFYVCKEEGVDRQQYTGEALFIDLRCNENLCWDTIYDKAGKILFESPKLGPDEYSPYAEKVKYRACKNILKKDFSSKEQPYDKFIDQAQLYRNAHGYGYLDKGFYLCLTSQNEIVYKSSISYVDTGSSSYYDKNGTFLGNHEGGMVADEKEPPVQTDFCREITEGFFRFHTKTNPR